MGELRKSGLSFDGDFTPEEVKEIFDALFDEARKTDEFEFACSLMRIRGLESAGWDPFGETVQLVNDLTSLSQTPLHPHTKVRLALLLYTHLIDVGAIFHMLANFGRVINGDRYSLDPFMDSPGRPRNRPTPTWVKVDQIHEDLKDKFPKVVDVLDWMIDSDVRNAFAHADYILFQDKFRSTADGFDEIHLDQIERLVNRALAVFNAMMDAIEFHRFSYKENKEITGRFAADESEIPLELLADEKRGLHGFRSLPREPSVEPVNP